VASGVYSHAEGLSTTAGPGAEAHAEGFNTTASGATSHAEGNGTTASALAAHAEGFGTNATSNFSHAEGNATTAAGGNAAHAEGDTTTAQGFAAHAEGSDTYAGLNAHAEGYQSYATGFVSHAEGQYTLAGGARSHAGGRGTLTDITYQRAQGCAATGGSWVAQGEAQLSDIPTKTRTTDGSTLNLLPLIPVRADHVYGFEITIVATDEANNQGDMWEIRGCVKNPGGAGAALIGGSPVISFIAGDTIGGSVGIVTIGGNSNMFVQVTGVVGKIIRWVARVELTEVGF
jgi:hypothetical protein